MKGIVRLLAILYVVTGVLYIILAGNAFTGGDLFEKAAPLVGFLAAGGGFLLLIYGLIFAGTGAIAVIGCNGKIKWMDISWYVALGVFVIELANTIYIISTMGITSDLVMKMLIPTVFTACLFLARKDEHELLERKVSVTENIGKKANSVKRTNYVMKSGKKKK